MNTRTIFVLLSLFFAGLLAMWWLDYKKVPTQLQRERMAGVVLPELAEVTPAELKRIEVLGHPKGKIVLERGDAGAWQMIEPVGALADQSLIETLLRNLRILRSLPGAETLKAAPNTFVVGQPERTLRLFAADKEKPVITLELGKKVESHRYVHNAARQGIEVVDDKLVAALDLPPVDWREKALFTLSTFNVDGVAITGSDRDMKAQRIEGRWQLVHPYKALLEAGKVEGVMAALVSLRASGGAAGFVADQVRDYAPFGLDKPRMRFELDPESSAGKAQVVEIGKDVPDSPGKAYARRADQNNVVLVETKDILTLGADPQVLRGPRVAELDLDLVYYVQLLINGQQHLLGLGPEGWRVLEPSFGRADLTAVRDLMGRLNDLRTSEFLDPAKTPKTELEKPWAVVKVWQRGSKEVETLEPPAKPPAAEPALTLVLGRHNALAKAVYAQVDGAPTILVLPDNLLQVLPNGPLGYRDRTLLALSPNDIERLTVERDGKVFEVKSGPSPGRFEEWKMTKPAAGPADMQTVAQLAVMLANLRADQLITDAPQDSAQYGFESPVLTCTWSIPQPGAPASKSAAAKASPSSEWTLTVGKPVSSKLGPHYARVSGNPVVFTLSAIAVQLLSTELRDHRVLAFMPQQVDRVVFHWPGREVALSRKLTGIPEPGKPEWQPDEGSDAASAPPERINDLLGAVSGLTAARFAQYDGKIPADTGLEPALVTIEIHTADRDVTHRIRLGKLAGENLRYATTVNGDSGPVAVIADAAWATWATKPPPTGKGEPPVEAIEKPKASP